MPYEITPETSGTIESRTCDQGHYGFYYCSVCLRLISPQSIDRLPFTCPGCGAKLKMGSHTTNEGGSDF